MPLIPDTGDSSVGLQVLMLYYSSDGDSGDGDNHGDSSDGDTVIVWLTWAVI